MGQITAFINSANYKGRPFSRYTDKFMMLSPSNFVASVLLMILLLSTGGQLAIVPYSVVKNPSALREYMLNEKITGSFMTPSLAMIFTAVQEKKDNKHPFNPEFRILLLSSEPARNIWFSDLEIYNVFGQSEMFFLGGVFNVDKPYEVTPIGSSMLEGTTLTLRDVKGCMGEICIENPYFRGYINLKEMTDYALRDGIYHTGDIGKYTDSGDIVILGRNDDMVKINGNRVEPAEIEAAAKKVLGVKWCAAKTFVKPDRAYVCVYHTEDTQVEETEAIRSMSEMLPAYMVPSRIMKIDSVPVNANGKMNRRALPEPIIERSEDYVAPRNDIEERICKAFSDILGISSVGTADDFYRMGGDSMKTIRLIGKLGISGVSAADIFRERTARNIAAFVMRMNTNDNKDELKTEKNARKKRYPLTDIQLDFCNIQQKYPESMMWVLPILYSFDIKDEEKLIEAVDKVKRTNAIFATVLEKDDNGTMWQRYDESVLSPTIAEQVTEEDIQSFRTEMKHRDLPFKMTGSPLAKIYVMRTEKGLYMLLLIHHVITDGMGIGAVIQNIKNSFAGKELLVDCYYTWLEHEFNDTNAESKLRSKHTLDALYSDVEWTCQIQPSSEERGTENGVFGVFVPITEEQLAHKEKEFGVSRTALFAGVMLLALARCTDRKDMFFAIGVQGIFVSMGSMMQGQKDDTGLLMLYRRCMMTGIPFTVILSLIQILFPKTIGRIYGADTPELLSATSNGLRLIALYSPPLAILMISIAVWQVCGFFRTATLVSGSMLMTVPLCLLLMSVSAPPFMIWWALPLSAVLTLFIVAAASSVCRKGKTHKLKFFTLLPKNNADKFVFEGSAEVNPKNKAELNALISQTVEYYDSLNIDKNIVSKICLCTEEMMIFLAEHSVRGKSFMDLRIVADSETVSVLLLDNCPPYDPLNGSDSVFSREILKAFCPDLDHRYSFGQNMTFMEWKINT